MRKIALLLSFFLLLTVLAEASVPVFPLNEIKAGMVGKGKTVFAGGTIEEFDVEILGVLHNFQPRRNLILAKLKNSILERAGIMEGMSGSPVYIDGKLAGAVAYSFPFSKEPIAGITPIEEMLSIPKTQDSRSSLSPQVPIKKHLTLDDFFEINRELFPSRMGIFSDEQTISPINIPLLFTGFSSQAFNKTKSFFSRLGFSPVRIGAVSQQSGEISIPDTGLREGDPVGVQLIGGDVDMSAVGTVTHVDGKKILAFGHPLYNLGTVDYAMTRARVLTVIPSLSNSFKIAATDKVVGSFSQDRVSGMYGELGKKPKSIPVNIRLLTAKGEKREFTVNVADDKILSWALVNVSVLSVMSVEERAVGDLTLDFSGDIYLENGMSIHLEDLFSGSYDNSVTDLSSLVAAVVFFLTNNEFQDLTIHRIDLDISASEELKFSNMEQVWLDKYDASAGEPIQIKIYTRNFRGESSLQEVTIAAPDLPSGSEFYLVIGDAVSIRQIEMSQYKTRDFLPRSLSQLIRLLGQLRKNNRIYFKIIAAKPGLFLKGEEMPNLPPTMKSMFSSSRAASSTPTELNRSTLREYQLPIPYVFKGVAVVPIKIK